MNDEIFAARYRRHEDELQALYMELYHGDERREIMDQP